EGDLSSAAQERVLWATATQLLPPATQPRAISGYTQGLMDLGATVCLARRPLCAECPVAAGCAARCQGDPERYPVKTRRLQRGRRSHALLWLQQGDSLWLTRRPEKGVWAGLWSLPEYPTLDAVHETTAQWPGQGQALPVIEHVLTHFDWTLQPLRWVLPARLAAPRRAAIESALPTGRWLSCEEALQSGLPAPLRKLLVTA
ncbi:MAG: NUDIX domain-containing protein, partial [Rubrivivax sp.]|nr:NUDIX domain-containing protein [Rubrivivax sp.]